MLKLSNKIFYQRHKNEIEKFILSNESLHIVNVKSSNNFNLRGCDQIELDLENEDYSALKEGSKKYSTIVLTDILENQENLYQLLQAICLLLDDDGRLVVSSLNSKYYFIVSLLEKLGFKDSNNSSSYIYLTKISKITNGLGLEYQKYYTRQIYPFKLFFIGTFINKILESIFFRFNFGIKTYMIFRSEKQVKFNYSKAIIIPAKNEEGNLEELIDRIPNFENTEIIFAYGESQDNTLKKMEEIINQNNIYKFKLIKQTKNGKANAVWEALNVVENDIVAILDADISVEPETLKDFFEILELNRADFVNGTRLIYDMDKNSMRYLNKLGNRFFQFFISRIIKESLTDSLCGTKVFKRSFIQDIKYWQNKFDVKDPFGDFDLIFSSAYTGQKIVELPISYKERRYGETQISRFRDGFKLLRYMLYSFIVFNTSNGN